MLEVKSMLGQLREAREAWGKGRTEFFSGYDWVLSRLVHEGAKNYMSDRDMADALGVKVKTIREKMRNIGLDPRAGKRVLSSRASQAMLENAAIMGIEPNMMDLTSPLAYLPMGEQMRKQFQDQTLARVTELEPEQVEDHYNALANRIYEEMPWEGASYEAVAERLASVLVNEGWRKA